MARCEPLGILVWLLAFGTGAYVIYRCIRSGEIFTGNFPASFNPISFFASRSERPIMFWTQVVLYSVVLALVLVLVYPSAKACLSYPAYL
jgi:hypothetical protein